MNKSIITQYLRIDKIIINLQFLQKSGYNKEIDKKDGFSNM